MTFWSGERLDAEIRKGQLIEPFDPGRIDCASYHLCVGEQVFATSDLFATGKPAAPLVDVLGDPPNHTLLIGPGQFAFLFTLEKVTVPNSAIALISMRAKYKWQGLVNVSGFHVDPGWTGNLLFSVYNAGAQPIIVEHGEPMFLIVYADLDRASEKVYDGKSKNQKSIKPALLQDMTLQVFSPMMLQRRIETLSTYLNVVSHDTAVTKAVTYSVTAVVTLALGLLAIFATFAPTTLGLVLGSVVQAGGYELHFKSDVQTRQAEVSAVEVLTKTAVPAASGAASSGAAAPAKTNKKR